MTAIPRRPRLREVKGALRPHGEAEVRPGLPGCAVSAAPLCPPSDRQTLGALPQGKSQPAAAAAALWPSFARTLLWAVPSWQERWQGVESPREDMVAPSTSAPRLTPIPPCSPCPSPQGGLPPSPFPQMASSGHPTPRSAVTLRVTAPWINGWAHTVRNKALAPTAAPLHPATGQAQKFWLVVVGSCGPRHRKSPPC